MLPTTMLPPLADWWGHHVNSDIGNEELESNFLYGRQTVVSTVNPTPPPLKRDAISRGQQFGANEEKSTSSVKKIRLPGNENNNGNNLKRTAAAKTHDTFGNNWHKRRI
ncbi:uncharacterized protein LOC142358397 [Convolutriloba macropyga]|uniref:uncharacterized protein LOC142358397 n=1 Tax=Convolutriloba macropyga TaxID=536237 RepID=UPI003F51CA23